MSQELSQSTIDARRNVLRLVLLLCASVGVAALIAPHVFNVLLLWGRSNEALVYLRGLEFEGVASRCGLLVVVLALWPLLKSAGLASFSQLGYAADTGWLKPTARALSLGCVTMGALFLAGWAMGAYTPATGLGSFVVNVLPKYLVGAIVVALIEETLFRGALFGLVRKAYGFWPSAVGVSVLFSIVHFAKAKPDVGVVHGHWNEGLRMIPHMFYWNPMDTNVFPMILTLFVMGLVLCLLYERTGHIYYAIGLHAGWVWMIRSGEELFAMTPRNYVWLFGHTDNIPKSYAALFMAFLFLLCVLVRFSPIRKRM